MLLAENLVSIESEGRRLSLAAHSDPDGTVPQYPDWTLRDLASHTASIHGRTVLICRELPKERISVPRVPEGMDPIDWYDETLEEMLAALGDMDPETSCWAFGPEQKLGFWERRMVIETGVHRWDAEQAVGRHEKLTDHVVSSALDEFPLMWKPHMGDLPTLKAVATDLNRTWVYGEGEVEHTVEGTGSDIYLRLVSRPSAVELPLRWAEAVDGLAPPPKR